MSEFPSAPVVVTGAAGYIEHHLVRSLIDRGRDVVAVVRPGKEVEFGPRVRVVGADILASDFDPAEIVAGAGAFIHLAWQDGFVHNSPAHMLSLS